MLRWAFVLVLSAVLDSGLAQAKPSNGNSEVLNCGDAGNKDICLQCCVSDDDCQCMQNACLDCCVDPPCSIIDVPPTTALTFPPLRLKLIVGKIKLQFERRGRLLGNQLVVDVKLAESFTSTISKHTIVLKTELTGANAGIGGLAYPVAFLGLGTAALDALHNQGLDVSFTGAPPAQTCPPLLGSQVCTALAQHLAESIDAALGTGDATERSAFLSAVQTLGYPPCQIIL
jgi:hypothetical protein